MAKLEAFEDISPTYAEKLRAAGVRTVEALYRAGSTPRGRRELAKRTGINIKHILTWVNRADLMRFRGVGQDYGGLLEQIGISAVAQLAVRDPDDLYEEIIEANEKKNLVDRPPSLRLVTRWVEQARGTLQVVSY